MLYGDALRTRISSQSWKRAVREHFQNELGDNALRTRRIGERVAEVLRGRGWDQALAERAGAHVAAGSSIKWEVAKGKDKQPITNKVLTNALVYLPEDAVEELADIAEAHKDSLTTDFTGKGKSKPESALKGKIDKVLLRRNGVINLFGRMLAEVDQPGSTGPSRSRTPSPRTPPRLNSTTSRPSTTSPPRGTTRPAVATWAPRSSAPAPCTGSPPSTSRNSRRT